ncbi:MAG: phosphoribosylamine--glycine ligase [Candidatus Levybacteria bacterium]|nr:phosphoribosylamine--glycine ligase [Candidatus Levybacteria bacterium]
MNILILGSGGREHVIADAYSKNKKVKKIFVAPGNPFIDFSNKKVTSLFDIPSIDFEKIKDAIKKFDIDLVDVAQDDPIALGFVDKLTELEIKTFGPTQKSSEIEWSKEWSRNFMLKYHLPIPHFKSFDSQSKGIFYVKSLREQPLYVKASGLALGKGAIKAENKKEAILAIKQMKSFGKAGETFVVEEAMIGEEFSLFAVCDGESFKILGSAQDHKTAFDGDIGPNTGGMGCVSNPKIITPKVEKEIENKILVPFMKGMKKEQRPYSGILYLGGMIIHSVSSGQAEIKIVEFNSRWGDPEAQVLIPGITSDYLSIVEAVLEKKLNKLKIKKDKLIRVSVAGCSRGYPIDYSKVKGAQIKGLEKVSKLPNINIYGAGISKKENKFVATGGRVFHLTGVGLTLSQARMRAYGAMSLISIENNNLHFRSDVGWRDMERDSS